MRTLFARYDYQKKGYLNWQEAKEFFSVLLDLNLARKRHYEIFLDLMKEIGYEYRAEEITVESIVYFFLRSDGIQRFAQIKVAEQSLLGQTVESQRHNTTLDLGLQNRTIVDETLDSKLKESLNSI